MLVLIREHYGLEVADLVTALPRFSTGRLTHRAAWPGRNL